MPLCPYANYIVLVFFAIVLISASFEANTRVAIFATAGWLIALVAAYYVTGLNKKDQAQTKSE